MNFKRIHFLHIRPQKYFRKLRVAFCQNIRFNNNESFQTHFEALFDTHEVQIHFLHLCLCVTKDYKYVLNLLKNVDCLMHHFSFGLYHVFILAFYSLSKKMFHLIKHKLFRFSAIYNEFDFLNQDSRKNFNNNRLIDILH